MVHLRSLATLAGAVGLAVLTAAVAPSNAQRDRAPEAIPYLPVITASQHVGETLTVCMYHGARPEQFRVVSASCRRGADHCTAFVALRSSEDQILIPGFDLLNPPVEATGSTCERPAQLTSGTLNPAEGGGNR